MLNMLIDAFAGVLTGVLSGMGIGGGTLLMLYMTTWRGIEQHSAQGINLLYFLPCAGAALFSHIKNRQVDFNAAWPAVCAGLVSGMLGAWLAQWLEAVPLRKFFGLAVVFVGIWELFHKKLDKSSSDTHNNFHRQ